MTDKPVMRCNHEIINATGAIHCKLSPGHRHVDHMHWGPGAERVRVLWRNDGTVSESNVPADWTVGTRYNPPELDDELRDLLTSLEATDAS